MTVHSILQSLPRYYLKGLNCIQRNTQICHACIIFHTVFFYSFLLRRIKLKLYNTLNSTVLFYHLCCQVCWYLEPVCRKKRQKKILTSCWSGTIFCPLKALNGTKFILDNQTHLESVWNHSGPSEVPYLLKIPITGQELFLPFLRANQLQ